MKLKRLLASMLAFCMILSTMGTVAFAEDAPVATVNGTTYTDLQEAIKAAAPNGTVDITKDVTIEKWVMFAQDLTIGTGQLITLNMDGLTIDGQGHSVTIESIESASNGGHLFSGAKNLNIKDLTFNQPEGLGGISLVSGEINNVTFNGGSGIFPGEGNIVIDGCTFKTDTYCIYHETARENLAVTNNTFEIESDDSVIFLRGNETFTGNTVTSGGKVRVVSGTPTVSGNTFSENVILKVYNAAEATIENNDIANIEIDDVNAEVNSTFADNTLSEEAETVLKDAGVIEESAPAVTYVAFIGEQGYETVQAAIDVAKNGETVEICAGEFGAINISNKNITIKGTVGANGELLTTIKGGNPAITGHSFNGTIQDIKIVDAWRVMYAEPAGNVTVDNVYVTGATYGFHLVAYTTGITWTIQNSYMDLRWANSFGVYNGGYADIIVKGNEFVSTDPYYPDYGALHVNSFSPNVTIEENIFRENARIYIDDSVTDTSNINVSKNYHADGVDKAFAVDEDGGKTVDIYQYYTEIDENGNLSGLVDARNVKIGDTYYTTLAEAINKATAEDTIELIADVAITEPLVIAADKTVKFDLNGFDITYSSTTQGEAMITNKGNLTINDTVGTGVINYNYTGAADSSYGKGNYTISNAGTLTVNGGKITIADLRGHAKYPIDNNSTTGNAVLVINGGHLYNYNTSAIRQFCNSTTYKNSVTINGGVIEGYCAIWVQNPGSNTVNGSLSITDGTVKTTAAAYVNGTSELKDVASKIYFTTEGGAWSEDSAVSITGGIIEENVYLAAQAPADITVDDAATYKGYVELPAPAAVAKIGETEYATLADALAAAQAGDEIVLLADVEGDINVPADVTFNGNGFAVSGGIIADGDITFAGITKAKDFDVENTGTTINIGKGASLELTGTDRLVVGHGGTFNIEGNIVDAKTANVAELIPSLIMPGASFTGAGVTFNVKDAYIKVPSSYCSSSKSASGTFDFHITNSVIEIAGKLAFESQSTAATVNFELKDSVLTTGSHLVFGVSRGEIVIDNSNVNVGTSRQIENQSTMTIKNGSVVNGAVATSSNAKNPGTIIVEDATYAVTGEFSGSDLGTGTIIVTKDATFSAGSITKANITIDATGMTEGEVAMITANLSKFAGTLNVINNALEAKIVDGKIVLAAKTVAQVGDDKFETLEEALAAAEEGDTIVLLDDIALDAPITIKKSVALDGNGKTITQSAECNNSIALLYFEGADGALLNAAVKDVTFDGLKTGAAIRTLNANMTIENCVFQNCEHTVGQGLVRLTKGSATVKNSKFLNNKCSMGISFNWDTAGNADDTLVVDNCEFTGNTANKTALIYYVKGAGCEIKNSEFKDNKVDTKDNCAVIYLGFQDKCTVTGNLFENNEVKDASASTRVAGTVFAGYQATITNNAFHNNTATNANGDTLGQICISTYYEEGMVDLSSNYWGGAAPVYGKDYTVQHQTGSGDYGMQDYYKQFELGDDGNVVLKDKTNMNFVAKVGTVKFTSFAEACAAAKDGDTITLIWAEGDAPIAMSGSVYGKSVTITGTATVDWSKGNLFVGRGGKGNGTVIFDNANLTSASNQASTGIHVSGREKNTTNKYDGTLIINSSTIELDYLINKGTMTLDKSTLTVKNGFSVGGRPASETESGADATATMTLNNGSKVIVNNHNGMGLGYEAIGVMNVNSGSAFECTQNFLITEKGTMNIDGGSAKINGTLTVNGTLTSNGDITGTIVNGENAVINLTGGTYTQDVSDWCTDGYVAIKELTNGNYVVGETPTATVNNLGAMTIPAGDYMSLGGGSTSEDMELSFVMQFLADQDETDMLTSPYADWYGDFVITFTGIENDSFKADGCYLAGYYGDFGWVKVPVDDMTVEEGVRYPVMLGYGAGQKYDYICESVKDFRCAMYLTPEILAANPNIKVNLELSIVDNSAGSDAATEALMEGKEGTFYKTGSTEYVAKDFAAKAVAKIGETEYATLQEAIDAAENGDTITIVADIEMTEPVVISGKTLTLDLGGYTISDKNTSVLTNSDNTWGLIALKDNANLTVCGNGAIDCNYANVSGGWTGMAYCFDVDKTSELTVNSGTFTNGNGGIQTAGKVTVNNGTFVSHNGGTCIMATVSDAHVTVNDGTFKDSVEESDRYTGSGAVWGGFGATINIHGGTYDFAADPEHNNIVWTLFPAQNAIAGYGDNANMAVSGGTFVNFNPATDAVLDWSASDGFTFGSVVADGYEVQDNGDGTYGVVEKEEDAIKLVAGTTATLDSSLALNFYLNAPVLTGTGYEAVIEHTKATGNVVTTVIPEAAWITSGTYKIVCYTGIAAKEMADNIKLTVRDADGNQIKEAFETSLRQYALETMENYKDQPKWLKALTDMLNYGAAAQIIFKYNTDDLASKGAEAYQEYASTEYTLSKEGCDLPSTFVAGTTLTLEDMIKLNVYFNDAKAGMKATYSFTTHGGTYVEKTVEFDSFVHEWGYYGVAVDDIAIADAATLVTVTLYNGDNTVVGTAKYSVNAYLKDMIDDGKEDEIYPALAKFAASAKAAFAK